MELFTVDRRTNCRCGKVCFTKKEAQTKKNQLERMGKEKHLRIYQCPASGGKFWHLTKISHWES